MTYENRLPANYSYGTLTSAAALSDTTLTSTDFATRLASSLSTTNYVPMTLQDPSTANFEVVWVNAHTASATTATVVRGKEGTSARAWASGTLWVIAPTLRDGVLPVSTRSQLPADPHVGLRAFIQDEQVVVQYVLNVGWLSHSGMAYRATQTLGADAGNVTFSGIPSTLKTVEVHWTGRCSAGAVVMGLSMRVNNDSTASYYTNYHYQQQTTITNQIETAQTASTVGQVAANTASAANWASGTITVPGWDNPGSRGAINYLFRSHLYDSAADSFYLNGGGMFTGAGPYTSLVIFAATGNLKQNSSFTVYGWG